MVEEPVQFQMQTTWDSMPRNSALAAMLAALLPDRLLVGVRFRVAGNAHENRVSERHSRPATDQTGGVEAHASIVDR